MNMLFRLTHHNVFRIQIQVFKLLVQFAKTTQSLSKNEVALEASADKEGAGESSGNGHVCVFVRTQKSVPAGRS